MTSIKETNKMVSQKTNNKNDIDVDLYGRGFDGIFGQGAEQIGRQEAMDRFKKTNQYKFGIRPDTYIDRDLYGRGDPRIFGSAAIIRSETESKAPTKEHRRRRVFVVPAGVMGKLAKYSRAARRAENDDDILIPLETVSSGEENTKAAISTIENTADNSPLKSTDKDTLDCKDIEEGTAEARNEAGGESHDINKESCTAAEDYNKMPAQGRVLQMIGSFERSKSLAPRRPVRASIGIKSATQTPQKNDSSNEQSGDQMPTAVHATPVTPVLESTSSTSSSSASSGSHNEPTTASKSASENSTNSSGPSSPSSPSYPHHDNVIKKTKKTKSKLQYASSQDGTAKRIASKDKTNSSSPNTSNGSNSNIWRRLKIRDCFSSSEHSEHQTTKSSQKYSSKSTTPKTSSPPSPSSRIARFIERRKGVMEQARRLFGSSSSGDDEAAKNTGSSTREGSTVVQEIKSAPLVVRKDTGTQTDPNIDTDTYNDDIPLPENSANETVTAAPPSSSSSSIKMPTQKTESESFNTYDFVTANQTIDFGNNVVSKQTNTEKAFKDSTSGTSLSNGVSSHSSSSDSDEVIPVIDATISSSSAPQTRIRSQSGHSNTGVSSTTSSGFDSDNIVAYSKSQTSSPTSASDTAYMVTQGPTAESTLLHNEICTAPVTEKPQHKPLSPSQRVPQWGSSSFHATMVQQIIALDEIEQRRSIEQQNSTIQHQTLVETLDGEQFRPPVTLSMDDLSGGEDQTITHSSSGQAHIPQQQEPRMDSSPSTPSKMKHFQLLIFEDGYDHIRSRDQTRNNTFGSGQSNEQASLTVRNSSDSTARNLNSHSSEQNQQENDINTNTTSSPSSGGSDSDEVDPAFTTNTSPSVSTRNMSPNDAEEDAFLLTSTHDSLNQDAPESLTMECEIGNVETPQETPENMPQSQSSSGVSTSSDSALVDSDDIQLEDNGEHTESGTNGSLSFQKTSVQSNDMQGEDISMRKESSVLVSTSSNNTAMDSDNIQIESETAGFNSSQGISSSSQSGSKDSDDMVPMSDAVDEQLQLVGNEVIECDSIAIRNENEFNDTMDGSDRIADSDHTSQAASSSVLDTSSSSNKTPSTSTFDDSDQSNAAPSSSVVVSTTSSTSGNMDSDDLSFEAEQHSILDSGDV